MSDEVRVTDLQRNLFFVLRNQEELNVAEDDNARGVVYQRSAAEHSAQEVQGSDYRCRATGEYDQAQEYFRGRSDHFRSCVLSST